MDASGRHVQRPWNRGIYARHMPSVSYNGHAFGVDGRRMWILGASLQYARIPVADWGERLAAVRQAGFNTVETACPWIIHEPRKGRWNFEGSANVRRFLEMCGEQRLRVILRAGPFIGDGFDGGGLPPWLSEAGGAALREGGEEFLERVSRYFRKLLGEVVNLQATEGGPLLLVQVEHAWTCGNESEIDRYLAQISRIIRECGISIPLIDADNLWTEGAGTIHTWRGSSDLLVNLRQLRVVQPNAPRLLSGFEVAALQTWGASPTHTMDADTMMRRMAEGLAAGAQPVVSPFHSGTNFAFLGGRTTGCDGGAVTTTPYASAPLGEAGARSESYLKLRRLVTFASHFAHVFAELDPDYQPVALDPAETETSSRGARSRGSRQPSVSIVPLRGTGGRVVFLFADSPSPPTTLLLEDGLRMPVSLGDQSVGWYVFNADLHGRGRLDYSNLLPFAIVGRSVLIVQGPARMQGYLSVGGTPLEAMVPNGTRPLVIPHKGLTILVCNQKQIDATYFNGDQVCVGIAGFDAEGRPIPAAGWPKAWTITPEGELAALETEAGNRSNGNHRTKRSLKLAAWSAAPADDHVNGQSPRYASLPGPQSLSACGAPTGYGWYRLETRSPSARKRTVHLPFAAHRIHLYAEGQPIAIVGDGPAATPGPFDLKLPKGDHSVAMLADNFGRFAEAAAVNEPAGVWGELYEVKPVKGVRAERIEAEPIDPFQVRRFISGLASGQRSDARQIQWTFTHAKKTPILIDVTGARARGTMMLNNVPLTYYAGERGTCRLRYLLDREKVEFMKRGKNVLRFAPDPGQDNALTEFDKALTLYECIDTVTTPGSWSFAKWEPPIASEFEDVPATQAQKLKGRPCWWRCHFDGRGLGAPLWFDTTGLSKGVAFINGQCLGRFFTATTTGRSIGPQVRLYVPASWLINEGEELLIFDEHGFSPYKTRLMVHEKGDLD